MKLDYLTPYTKVNSEQFKDLNIRPETIKYIEINITTKLINWLQSDFFELDPQNEGSKSKNKLMGLHQSKQLLHNESNHQQNKNATNQMEKIFANKTSDKGLISKLRKELILIQAAARGAPYWDL